MTRDTFKLTSLAALIAATPALALAQLTVGSQMGVDAADIRAMLESQGAEVIEIEFEDDEIEIEEDDDDDDDDDDETDND